MVYKYIYLRIYNNEILCECVVDENFRSILMLEQTTGGSIQNDRLTKWNKQNKMKRDETKCTILCANNCSTILSTIFRF